MGAFGLVVLLTITWYPNIPAKDATVNVEIVPTMQQCEKLREQFFIAESFMNSQAPAPAQDTYDGWCELKLPAGNPI